ncbi:MAG: glycosyltransferase [Acutalibacteraceae bacterium]|jgi:glycosyltransferase involved in cell wall biosynthesis
MGKRILVVDVAAHEGGALTILRQFYREACADTDNVYGFCVSLPELEETANVSVKRFPWVKKGWLHRLWFDHVTVQKAVRQFAPDEILSLQNLLVSRAKVPQTLYLHQPLPFSPHRFSLKQNPKFWVYQHLIARGIYRSVRRASTVIVQTEWMKRAVCEKCGITGDSVVIEPPVTAVQVAGQFDYDCWDRLFFFPAAPYAYKNHAAILQAMLILRRRGITDYRVQFTLTPQQLPLTAEQEILRDQLILSGAIPGEEVMELYTRAALIFPSYIETYGLPLLEARLSGAPILASDEPFSHEILDGYGDVAYFDPFDPVQLADKMAERLEAKP